MPSDRTRRLRPRAGASASARHRPRRATPTPPDLVLEPEDPVGVSLGQADQPVARPFFRRYAGSGLVIHRLARFQPIPIRISAWRTDSPLSGREVIPRAKATWATNPSVQSEVGLPKSRGLRWSRARSRSQATPSNSGWADAGRCECGWRQSAPVARKARIAFRT